jgi:hypothetical protein
LAIIPVNSYLVGFFSVCTSIVLPLLEKSPDLLEVTNQQGQSCRDLLDKLVQKRQTQTHEEKVFNTKRISLSIMTSLNGDCQQFHQYQKNE